MRKVNRIVLFIISLLGLVGVRFLESKIFYDPFLEYFKSSGTIPYPDFVWGKLIFSHLFRYLLNILFSCGIVYSLFCDKKLVKITIGVMTIVFIIIFPLYLWCIGTNMEIGHLITFYLRRFVIQPLLLLLIIPIFYFQKKIKRA